MRSPYSLGPIFKKKNAKMSDNTAFAPPWAKLSDREISNTLKQHIKCGYHYQTSPAPH